MKSFTNVTFCSAIYKKNKIIIKNLKIGEAITD